MLFRSSCTSRPPPPLPTRPITHRPPRICTRKCPKLPSYRTPITRPFHLRPYADRTRNPSRAHAPFLLRTRHAALVRSRKRTKVFTAHRRGIVQCGDVLSVHLREDVVVCARGVESWGRSCELRGRRGEGDRCDGALDRRRRDGAGAKDRDGGAGWGGEHACYRGHGGGALASYRGAGTPCCRGAGAILCAVDCVILGRCALLDIVDVDFGSSWLFLLALLGRAFRRRVGTGEDGFDRREACGRRDGRGSWRYGDGGGGRSCVRVGRRGCEGRSCVED